MGAAATIAGLLRPAVRVALDVVFPWGCIGCELGGTGPLCETCRAAIRWLDGPVCSCCGLPFDDGTCGRCIARRPAFTRARAIAAYRSSDEDADPIGVALRGLKYHGRRSFAGPLAELLTDRFPYAPGEHDLVVPVPLHLTRLRSRGYNQALLLARGLARGLGMALSPRALARIRETAPQVGLEEKRRRNNLAGAIVVREPPAVAGRRVLVVDDVCTTGATGEATADALLAAGAVSVDVLAVARALLD